MKKLILLTGIIFIISGCATGMNGLLVTNVTEPVNTTSNDRGSKTGESSCVSVFGCFR